MKYSQCDKNGSVRSLRAHCQATVSSMFSSGHRYESERSVTTRRTWTAVTSATSSAGPRRTASRSWHQDVRPDSRAATKEHGQSGMNWSDDLPLRP
ncbi:hypothetical protein ADK43_02475 [Streptomyces rimosus subsp. rimosus]|nr:hypothetical protein ADK43_02475 [Streptomyces rimosus subsp. rimosus]